MEILVAAILGFSLDLILGDPQGIIHPVRLIGKMISKGEEFLRKCMPKKS